KLDVPRALLRGRAMKAAAHMEHQGVPIDVPKLTILRREWAGIQDALIARIDQHYGVYDGRTFKRERFAAYLARTGTPWPRLVSGALDLEDDTFKEMARSYPHLTPLHELRASLSQMRLEKLAVGHD